MTTIFLQPVDSSNIASIGYDEETKTLAVVFKKKNNFVNRYHYSDVPKKIYDNLMTSDSVGKYFHTYIRGIFKYHKVS